VNVAFGIAPSTAPFATFDNAAGINVGGITQLSVPAVNGAFVAKNNSGEYGSPGSISNGGGLTLTSWLAANGFASGNLDTDHDGLTEILEFAFGLDPRVNDNRPNGTDSAAGAIVSRGTPTIRAVATGSGQEFSTVFIRRKNAAAAGLTSTVQFSGDLKVWENSAALPTIIASDAEMEAVSVAYPAIVNGVKTQFARVAVTPAP
jgi:hypothetical protein